MLKKKSLYKGIGLLIMFVVWTFLVQTIDVKMIPTTGTKIGFASINIWFHKLSGVHLNLYYITDWLGLVPIFVCMYFAGIGLKQLIERKSIFKVDFNILILGVYYVFIIVFYLLFEMYPINYRPILIEGRLEASYPSSTTLLILSVMPTLLLQLQDHSNHCFIKKRIDFICIIFIIFVVIARVISGVHWLSDIIGSILLSTGLFQIYKSIIS